MQLSNGKLAWLTSEECVENG